jgi:hypothetical protein
MAEILVSDLCDTSPAVAHRRAFLWPRAARSLVSCLEGRVSHLTHASLYFPCSLQGNAHNDEIEVLDPAYSPLPGIRTVLPSTSKLRRRLRKLMPSRLVRSWPGWRYAPLLESLGLTTFRCCFRYEYCLHVKLIDSSGANHKQLHQEYDMELRSARPIPRPHKAVVVTT